MFKFNFKKIIARTIIIASAPFVAAVLMNHILYLALKPNTKYEDLEKLCSYYKQD